jgi:hypothetical protein
MAANTCTSASGTASGTDPNFVVSFKTAAIDGVVLMVKYTKGTEDSISITLDTINPSLHATDKYRHITMSGAAVSSYTFTMSATGNYRIPIELLPSETKLYANVVFSASGQSGAVVVNMMEA